MGGGSGEAGRARGAGDDRPVKGGGAADLPTQRNPAHRHRAGPGLRPGRDDRAPRGGAEDGTYGDGRGIGRGATMVRSWEVWQGGRRGEDCGHGASPRRSVARPTRTTAREPRQGQVSGIRCPAASWWTSSSAGHRDTPSHDGGRGMASPGGGSGEGRGREIEGVRKQEPVRRRLGRLGDQHRGSIPCSSRSDCTCRIGRESQRSSRAVRNAVVSPAFIEKISGNCRL